MKRSAPAVKLVPVPPQPAPAPMIGPMPSADPLQKITDDLLGALDKMAAAAKRFDDANDEASDKAMREILKRLPHAVDKLCVEMYWNKIIAAGFMLIFACAFSFGVGWYFGHVSSPVVYEEAK